MLKGIRFYALIASLLVALGLSAQVTTSALIGMVTDEKNESLIGATVKVTHTPSGTKYNTVSNTDGRFTIQGMRPGGPYTVEVSYIGYEPKVLSGLTLELGNPLELNVKMEAGAQSLDELVVLGTGAVQRAGASHNFSIADIENTATINRNVFDVVKNMPLANNAKNGGTSFGGSSIRYNSFQIDGTVANDVFGLSSDGVNGGMASANPISMDAIQEIQVVVAPFDVRQSGFTGGGVNAVTKQGTNDFHATYFTYYNNENFYGRYNAAQDYAKMKLTKQHETRIGGNISGPIVKDKLFFFFNVENHNSGYPPTYYPGVRNYMSNETAQIIADKYKALTGQQESWGPRDVKRNSLELLARIDWNINDKHHLALRYQHGDSYRDYSGASYTSYYFNNSLYKFRNVTNSFVAELNSNFNSTFYNELRASYNRVRDNRDVPYQGPTFWIKGIPNELDPTDPDYRTNISVNIGTHYVSGVNQLDQDIFMLEDNLSIYKGNHTITVGTHNELFYMKNYFVQYSNGEWVYNTFDDFLNDAPNTFYFRCINPEMTGGNLRWAPTIKAAQFGFYAQDKWDINRNFQLTYGIRFDIPVMLNSPTENPEMNAYYKSRMISARIGTMPSTKVMVSPRVGFRWFANDKHTTLFRGGLGLFTGRVPFVWISNAYGNNGVEQIGTQITNVADIPAPTANTADLVSALSTGKLYRSDIATVDKKFRYPQVFRANLAWEQELGRGWKFVLEGLYSKTYNQVYFNNMAITQQGAIFAVEGVQASAAPFYKTDPNCANIINLENTDKGYAYNVSASIEKKFDFGLNLSASYTFGHAKSVYDAAYSSIALSSWKATQDVDTKHPHLAYSAFDQPHRVRASVTYTTPRYANGWLQTSIGLTYDGYSGQRYSLTMNESPGNGYNNDGTKGNSLLYIPTEDELAKMDFADITARVGGETVVTKTADEQRALFNEFIMNDKYAKNHRGQYAERNSNLAPFEHQVDLHIAQSIFYLKKRGSKIQLTFDVLNFANMLNKKWGASWGTSTSVTPLNNTSYSAKSGGMYVAKFTWNGYTEPSESDIASRWHAQVGVRVTF